MKKTMLYSLLGLLFLQSCKKPETTTSSGDFRAPILQDELRSFGPSSQTFVQNSENTIGITTEKGNVITFPANAFVDDFGNPITGNVEIRVKEITTRAEMILSNMMTNSDQGPLDSQGEFLIEVFQNGTPVNLASNTSFTINNPNDSASSDIQAWEWIPNIDQENGGDTTGGTWTATGDTAQSPCEEFSDLVDLVKYSNVISTEKKWEAVSNIKSLLKTEFFDQNPSYNMESYYINNFTWNTDLIKINLSNNYWANTMQNQQAYNKTIIDVNGFDYGNAQIPLRFDGCTFYEDTAMATPIFSLDPNALLLRFRELTWCNIDRLIWEYGPLYNCKIKVPGVTTNANVRFVFPSVNGALSATYDKDNYFLMSNLPNGMQILVLVYYKDTDGKLKFGSQTITASQNMEFDTSNLETVDSIEKLAEKIEEILD